MTISVRMAGSQDAPALHRMNAAFNGDTGVSVEEIRRSLFTDAEIVVIAEAGCEPAGFCCAQVHHSFCYPAPVAEVTEMYVCEAFRRMGCAGAMLRFLEEHLQQTHGVDEMHLLTGMENLAAQHAYSKAGFAVKNECYLVKEVPPKR